MALARDNTKGRTTAFGTYSELRGSLSAGITRGALSALRLLRPEQVAQRLSFLHYAHWVVMSKSDLNRVLRPRGAKVDRPYLFFFSQFSGDWDHYLTAFSVVLTNAIDTAWSGAKGFPGSRSLSPFIKYVGAHELESQAFYQAYSEADAQAVRGALHLSDALERFAAETDGLQDDALLRRAYERLLLTLGADLSN